MVVPHVEQDPASHNLAHIWTPTPLFSVRGVGQVTDGLGQTLDAVTAVRRWLPGAAFRPVPSEAGPNPSLGYSSCVWSSSSLCLLFPHIIVLCTCSAIYQPSQTPDQQHHSHFQLLNLQIVSWNKSFPSQIAPLWDLLKNYLKLTNMEDTWQINITDIAGWDSMVAQ